MGTKEHLKSSIGSIKSIWDFYNILPIDISWSTADIVISAKKRLSLSRATTYRYIKMLQEKNLIDVTGRGTRKLTNNENVTQIWKEVSLPPLDEKVGDRKTFVKTRH